MSNQTDSPELLDVPMIAAYLDLTERQVRNIIARRLIPVVKIGQLVRMRRADIDAYLESNTIPAASTIRRCTASDSCCSNSVEGQSVSSATTSESNR